MIKKIELKQPPCRWVEGDGTRCIATARYEVRRGPTQADLDNAHSPDVQRLFYCGRHVQQGERLQRQIEAQERTR